ncbi:MAG TPA: NrfD/PsrC family molybdoenzyme membrane anchor subunit [Coriobacteriia bacterium]
MQISDRPPVIAPGYTPGTVTDKISAVVLNKTPRWWYVAFGVSFIALQLLLISMAKLLVLGVGIWGVNIPVGWGLAIVNFVWWIGIGHAGTLISAILLLLRQTWRTSINRFAEAMTLFAVAAAGTFVLFHTGRQWLAVYWLFPYPNTMGLWPQFRSPLMWDVFAVSTYATISAVFWFVGLIPDLATLRDRSKSPVGKIVYGMLAMGWRGSARHWHNYEVASLLLAGLATPLVVSVHTVVSFDFAVGIVPGWHATIFPPYFVAGAIYSGFAMVMTLSIPLRKLFGLEDFITMRHLQNMAKIMLATGLIVAYGYAIEMFMAWYSGNQFEQYMMRNRILGPYGRIWFLLILCNILTPQLLWLRKVRNSVGMLFVISIVVNIGMWLERFVIVVTSLHRDFLPSSWDMYTPTRWDWAFFVGSLGLFFSLMFLFIRFLPVISIFEMRTIAKGVDPASADTKDMRGRA